MTYPAENYTYSREYSSFSVFHLQIFLKIKPTGIKYRSLLRDVNLMIIQAMLEY